MSDVCCLADYACSLPFLILPRTHTHTLFARYEKCLFSLLIFILGPKGSVRVIEREGERGGACGEREKKTYYVWDWEMVRRETTNEKEKNERQKAGLNNRIKRTQLQTVSGSSSGIARIQLDECTVVRARSREEERERESTCHFSINEKVFPFHMKRS